MSVFFLLQGTILTQTVENGAVGIQLKMMMGGKVSLQHFELIALQMDQTAAAGAFAVKARSMVRLGIHIFEAGGAAFVDDVFVDEMLLDELVELTVDRGGADGLSAFLEMGADIRGGNMLPGAALQIGQDFLALMGVIDRFHDRFLAARLYRR